MTAPEDDDGAADPANCNACSEPLPDGAKFCRRCGSPQEGAPKCPHCGGIAGTSEDSEVVLKCKACGAPRVVIDGPGIELSGAEQEHLEAAKKARTGRLGWWIGSVIAALAAAGTLSATALVALLLGVSFIAAGVGIALTLPFLLLALAGFRKAGARTQDVNRAVDAAWVSAAKDVVEQSKEPVTAEQLSKMLPMSQERSEQLLARLAVDDMLSSDITAEGRLSLAPALRIESPSEDAAETELAELEQLAAAEAEAEAEATAKARTNQD
ncbi:MAG: hypothetical protein JRI23_24700 [Deltaproteobacteria bacterium]|jgi:hypothetical protein|nr:hypothetical protein [Deltaproteobacteria bacterium]MBW2535203.1 hypothetical protein [Deltaproteobacteria bacterium]